MLLESNHSNSGKVIRILNEYEVIVNVGKKDGIYYGQKLGVYKLLGEVTDPYNDDKFLGRCESLIETLTPLKIDENYSILYKRNFAIPSTSHVTYPLANKEALILNVDDDNILPFEDVSRQTIKLGDTVKNLPLY